MLILIKLLLVHIFVDFFLQTKNSIEDRKAKKFASAWLYIHAFTHALGTFFLLGMDLTAFFVACFIFLSHAAIDLFKAYQEDSITWFLIDQTAHILVIITLWLLFYENYNVVSQKFVEFYTKPIVWGVLAAYVLVTKPTSILMYYATRKWCDQAFDDDSEKGLEDAGKWIGIIERVLILTFIFVGHVEATGFLVASKSILRFNEMRKENSLKRTEYVLVGTFLSVSISMIFGFLVKYLLF